MLEALQFLRGTGWGCEFYLSLGQCDTSLFFLVPWENVVFELTSKKSMCSNTILQVDFLPLLSPAQSLSQYFVRFEGLFLSIRNLKSLFVFKYRTSFSTVSQSASLGFSFRRSRMLTKAETPSLVRDDTTEPLLFSCISHNPLIIYSVGRCCNNRCSSEYSRLWVA